MKKFLLIAALLSTAVCVNAQYKPEKGTLTTEVGFNPFSSTNFNLTNNSYTGKGGEIKLRYFITEKNALRIKLGISGTRDNTSADLQVPNEEDYKDYEEGYKRALANYNINKDDESTTSQYAFNLDLGYEHHFDVAKRLNAYVGAEVGIVKGWGGSYSMDYYGSEWNSKSYKYSYVNSTETKKPSSNYLGLHVAGLAGMDFYCYKGLYVGTEISFGFNSNFNCNYTTTTTTVVKNVTTKTEQETDARSSSTSFGFKVIPCIRLGWAF